MSKAQPATLGGGLIAKKGTAAPATGAPARGAPTPEPKVEEGRAGQGAGALNSEPLNFRVSKDFRRRFREYAARHDLKLNELLMRVFDDYAKRNP